MLVLCKVKVKWIFEFVFWLILLSAFAMGIYAIRSETDKQPGQVNIPLYTIEAMQQELVDRGHDITVDGIYGPETDHALNMEISK